MADNVVLNAATSAGAKLATDDYIDESGELVHHQRVKIQVGTNGAGIDVSAADPMPVSGPLTDTQLRATAVPVSGTVTASGPLTDVQLRATAVPISGPLTDAELRATAVPVSGTVTANGPLTDTQLRATPVTVTGPLTDAELRASAVPVSAAALPLPTGAATEATLSTLNGKVTACNTGAVTVSSSALPSGAATETTVAALNTKTPALGQAVMASSVPVALASDQGAVPVSASALPLPTGAATETTLAAGTVEKPQNMSVDEASSTVTYQGWAPPGTATSATAWRMRRITISGTVTSITWADGNSNYDNIWDNRAALSYS
jgi:hypothetical protein